MKTQKTKRLLAISIIAALTCTLLTTQALGAVKTGSSCSKLASTSISSNMTYTCVKKGSKLVWDNGVSIASPIKSITFPTDFIQVANGSRFAYQLSDYTGKDSGKCKQSGSACTVVNIFSIDKCNKFSAEMTWRNKNNGAVIEVNTVYAFIPQVNFTGKFEFDASTTKILAPDVDISIQAFCNDNPGSFTSSVSPTPNPSTSVDTSIKSICWWIGQSYGFAYNSNQTPDGCVKESDPITINYCSNVPGDAQLVNAWQYISFTTANPNDEEIIRQPYTKPITKDGFVGVGSSGITGPGDSFGDESFPQIGNDNDSFRHSYYRVDIYWRAQGSRLLGSAKCPSGQYLINIELPNSLLNSNLTVRLIQKGASNPGFFENPQLEKQVNWKLSMQGISGQANFAGRQNSADYILNWKGGPWTSALMLHMHSVIRTCTSNTVCTYKLV